jgi:NAD(P)-dependent dehydrogenase (short-subunit alcohol dehydrogenase family)
LSEKEFRLDGRVILVSGAAGLIGREVCDAFAAYGANVVLCDVAPQERLSAQAVALSERYAGATIEPAHADITLDEDVSRLMQGVMNRFGRLDVLVNLAAIDAKFDAAAGDINPSRFEQYPLELWEQSVAVNMTGLLRLTQAAVRLMLAQKSGNIINVASTYSLVAPNQALYRFPGQESQTYKPVDYVGTKSFVPNFTRYLATLYAGDGIRANTIVPHGVDNRHDEAFKQNFKRYSPLGRMCEVRELRGPFVFLASDASSYMTGSTLVVDGGWTAW